METIFLRDERSRMNHRTINPRLRNLLQRLIITGNNAALVASDPETFSPGQRADVVAAWDEAVSALRESDRASSPTDSTGD